MVQCLLSRYTEWQDNKDNNVDPPLKKKPRRKGGKDKPERTNKSKNGFKYKLKLDYIPIRGILEPQNKRLVERLLPNKVNSVALSRKIEMADSQLNVRPLVVSVTDPRMTFSSPLKPILKSPSKAYGQGGRSSKSKHHQEKAISEVSLSSEQSSDNNSDFKNDHNQVFHHVDNSTKLLQEIKPPSVQNQNLSSAGKSLGKIEDEEEVDDYQFSDD